MLKIPYPGNKAAFYKSFFEFFKKRPYDRVYEPFGGSGVLSVNLYIDGLTDDAVINDYDGFFDDYKEYLDIKDYVVREAQKRGVRRMNSDDYGHFRYRNDGTKEYVDGVVLPENEQKILQGIISGVDNKLFMRHLETDVQREFMDVMDNFTIESMDYRDFLSRHKDEFNHNTLIIADPPYVGKKQAVINDKYNGDDHRILLDQLMATGSDFVIFTKNMNYLRRWARDRHAEWKTVAKRKISSHESLTTGENHNKEIRAVWFRGKRMGRSRKEETIRVKPESVYKEYLG